jgi:hypothetical protein
MTTPTKPSTIPTTLSGVGRSSGKKSPATTTANIGVAAFKIDAKPEAIWVCPHTIKTNGIALFSKPIAKNEPQIARLLGDRNPKKKANDHKANAAMPTLKVTIVRGGKSLTAIPTKKNEPPHIVESRMSIAHTFEFIDWEITEDITKTLKMTIRSSYLDHP